MDTRGSPTYNPNWLLVHGRCSVLRLTVINWNEKHTGLRVCVQEIQTLLPFCAIKVLTPPCASHLLLPSHCYHFKRSLQRQFPHFLQRDSFLGLFRQVRSHTAVPRVFSLVSLSLSSSSPDPPGLSIAF